VGLNHCTNHYINIPTLRFKICEYLKTGSNPAVAGVAVAGVAVAGVAVAGVAVAGVAVAGVAVAGVAVAHR
jgi:hypothetical protein